MWEGRHGKGGAGGMRGRVVQEGRHRRGGTGGEAQERRHGRGGAGRERKVHKAGPLMDYKLVPHSTS